MEMASFTPDLTRTTVRSFYFPDRDFPATVFGQTKSWARTRGSQVPHSRVNASIYLLDSVSSTNQASVCDGPVELPIVIGVSAPQNLFPMVMETILLPRQLSV